jgi:integration host factor subunit alpha
MALTKADIVQSLVDQNGYAKIQATDLFETLLEIIKSTLASGEDVMVSNFGKFKVKEKTPRKGRNPSTGETMTLKARKVITFQCARKLRDMVNPDIQ